MAEKYLFKLALCKCLPVLKKRGSYLRVPQVQTKNTAMFLGEYVFNLQTSEWYCHSSRNHPLLCLHKWYLTSWDLISSPITWFALVWRDKLNRAKNTQRELQVSSLCLVSLGQEYNLIPQIPQMLFNIEDLVMMYPMIHRCPVCQDVNWDFAKWCQAQNYVAGNSVGASHGPLTPGPFRLHSLVLHLYNQTRLVGGIEMK